MLSQMEHIKIPLGRLEFFQTSWGHWRKRYVGQWLSFNEDRLVYDDYRDDLIIGAKNPFREVWFIPPFRLGQWRKDMLVTVCPFVMIG